MIHNRSAGAMLCVFLLAALAFRPAGSLAATRIWDGSGANDNWRFVDGNILSPSFADTNWTEQSVIPLPLPGDNLLFAGQLRTSPNNDFVGLALGRIDFAAGANSFTLLGNEVGVRSGISNASGRLQTVVMPISLLASQSWSGGDGQLRVGASGLNLGGHTLTLERNVILGDSVTDLEVIDGRISVGPDASVITRHLTLAATSGSDAGVSVNGANARWQTNGQFSLGARGTATLDLGFAGRIESDGALIGDAGEATATVTDQAVWTAANHSIGVGALGKLFVRKAASLESGASLLGVVSAGHGIAEITDPFSRWAIADRLVVGVEGTGEVTVSNGAALTARTASLGFVAGGEGTLSVTSLGSVTISDDLTISAAGSGTLNIVDGSVTNAGGLIGIFPSSLPGTVNVSGRLASWTNRVGLVLGQGTLNIDTGARVDSPFSRAQSSVSASKINITGANSKLVTTQFVQLGNLATLYLADGGSVETAELRLQNGSVTGEELNLDKVGAVTGFGIVTAAIRGGNATSRIAAVGGNLALGDVASTRGFEFDGILDAGGNHVTLADLDAARLGVTTLLGEGATLESTEGLELAAGRELIVSGKARVIGGFKNDGTVHGGATELQFDGPVTGAGHYSGRIAFANLVKPGNDFAALDFNGGDVSFAATSLLEIEMGGPGADDHDHLVGINLLDFSGELSLVFRGEFATSAPTRIDLFDFGLLAREFDRARINVSGVDRARLDFSMLDVDGSIGVSAVPVPPAILYLSSALGLLFKARTRHVSRNKPGCDYCDTGH